MEISTTNKLTVSIIINNYNYDRYIGEAIDSALNQSYDRIEVIVVDDGSTDDSRKIISYYDRIIPVLKENGGQASALNAGFAASKGDIICFLDSDDIFAPGKVEEVVRAFNLSPDIGWCFHPLHTLDMSESAASVCFPNTVVNQSIDWIDFRTSIKNGNQPNFVPQCSAISFSRSLLNQILPMPEDEKTYIGDTYISMAALYLSKGCVLSSELTIYRVHGDNAYSRKNLTEKLNLFFKLRILTGYWLKVNFPDLAKYTNIFFAKGLGSFWLVGESNAKFEKVIKEYLLNLSFSEKFKVVLRASYYYLKSLLPKALP